MKSTKEEGRPPTLGRLAWLLVFAGLSVLYLLVALVLRGGWNWYLAYFLLGLALATTGTVFGLVKMNLWWLRRIQGNHTLESFYLVVLATFIALGVLAILNASCLLSNLLGEAIALSLGVAVIFVLRRAQIKKTQSTL
jgi:predicted neutral ceramidase superfamily lipid hydrolase